MKTITLDDEAYEVLAGLKIDRTDSFSKVVKRHFKSSGKLASSAGAWSDMTDEEMETLRKETIETFSGTQGD